MPHARSQSPCRRPRGLAAALECVGCPPQTVGGASHQPSLPLRYALTGQPSRFLDPHPTLFLSPTQVGSHDQLPTSVSSSGSSPATELLLLAAAAAAATALAAALVMLPTR